MQTVLAPGFDSARCHVNQHAPWRTFSRITLGVTDPEVLCAAAEMLCQPVGVAAGNPAGIAMIPALR